MTPRQIVAACASVIALELAAAAGGNVSAQSAPVPSPAPTDTPVVSTPTPSPSATATPPPAAATAPTILVTPVPVVTPSPQASATPAPPPPAIASPAPAAPVTPSPIASPSALPVPRPFATGRRTVPDSMNDPRVPDMIAHPIPELVLFDWLKGTWRSHTIVNLPAGAARDLGTNTYVFAYVLKNRWIFGATGRADDEFYITYDPFARRYALLRIEGDPSYGMWVSYEGWHGNRIVFASNVSSKIGRPYVRRITFDRKDVRTFDILTEEQTDDGSWITDDAIELTKQSS